MIETVYLGKWLGTEVAIKKIPMFKKQKVAKSSAVKR
jgi:hypothetical protein